MSITAGTALSGRTFRPSFFFWITVVMALFVFAGFSLTYWQPMVTGKLAPTPPFVHVHGSLFSLWMLLLITQAFLVNTRRVALHKSLGLFGIAVATAMIVTGLILALFFGKVGFANPSPDYATLMYLSYMAVFCFALLFVLAIRNTGRPENHRRLILLATIPLLPPGINRLYMVMGHLSAPPVLATYLTMDAIALAILVHEWRKGGKLSATTTFAAAVILLQQILHAPIVNSAWFADFNQALIGLVSYR
jgi:hypothetical protein